LRKAKAVRLYLGGMKGIFRPQAVVIGFIALALLGWSGSAAFRGASRTIHEARSSATVAESPEATPSPEVSPSPVVPEEEKEAAQAAQHENEVKVEAEQKAEVKAEAEDEANEAAEDEDEANEAAEEENEAAEQEVEAAPTPTPTPTPSSSPAPSSKTFNLVGGTVTFRCQGNTISLVSVSPKSGFSSEVETEDGGQKIEVKFESRTHESRIEAICSGGQVQATEIREESKD